MLYIRRTGTIKSQQCVFSLRCLRFITQFLGTTIEINSCISRRRTNRAMYGYTNICFNKAGRMTHTFTIPLAAHGS
jgi:hypothetical protein